ncbi:hypothetical protein JHK84_052374 [Glycine max]|nr:hypothetical protein JHK85_053189 [Glycine max]KAG5082336.1 hypothetical protein JHK84_052374 [Glycine max]
MDNHEHANHSDTAQARIKNKGIRQHKVNDQAQNIDFNIRDSSEDESSESTQGCVSVSSPENQNYMSSANDPAINREALQLDDRTLQNLVLLEIEELLQVNQRSLRDYPSMPYPEDANCPVYLDNSLILAELNYNNEELISEFEHLFSHMIVTSTMASASSTASSKLRLPAIKQQLILQFKAAFHCDKDVIEIPGFYQRQWLPNYPEIVEFKYDGETYEIQDRQHKGKLYFADGLTRLRTELQIYESVTINFLACDHPSKFDLHFTPPLDQFGPPLQWNVVVLDKGIGDKYITLPWYKFLQEGDFSHGDELSFYYRRAEKIWKVVIRRAIDWDDSDID